MLLIALLAGQQVAANVLLQLGVTSDTQSANGAEQLAAAAPAALQAASLGAAGE